MSGRSAADVGCAQKTGGRLRLRTGDGMMAAIMNARTQITMDPEMQRRAHAKAAALGISFAEYMRRLVQQDLGEPEAKADISIIFDLVTEGEPTDISRDKDKLIGDAVWEEYLAETRQKPKRRQRAK
ncbi:MAG TPA: hypothetical protein VGF29_14510 [Hyphomicrobiaceae bacterium]